MGSSLNPAQPDLVADEAAPERPARSVLVGLLLSAVVVVLAVAARASSLSSWPFWDLDVYVAGAQAVLDHGDLYTVSAHGLLFTYPPFAGVLFVPLVLAGTVAGPLLSLLSLVCLAVVAVVVARRLELPAPVTGLVVVGSLVLEPVTRTLVLGQINLLLVACVVLDLFVVPSRWRGLLVGLAAGVKLTPALFVVYFLLRRDYRSAARAAGGFATTVLVGWLLAPDASTTYWSGRVLAMSSFGDYQVQSANQSLRGVLIRILGVAEPPTLLWALPALAVLAFGVWVAWRRIRSQDEIGAVLALAVSGLLVSPISWTHHWVWVVVALPYAVAHRWYLVAWLVGLVFFLAPMWFLPGEDRVELHFGWWQVALSGTYVIVGVVALILQGLRPTRRRSEVAR